MGATPSSPIQIGIFFEYPSGSSPTDVGAYWLAANGHNVRMSPQCRTALLATFEAALERAVAPSNVGDTVQNLNELSANTLGGNTTDLTIVGVQPWDDPLYRAEFKNKFIRGCPKEDWNALVELVWKLWKTSGRVIQINGNSLAFMGWQSNPMQLNTNGWVSTSGGQQVNVPWVYDLSETACDEGYAQMQQQYYAPWGSYTGPQYPRGRVTDWAIQAFESLGCDNATAGSPASLYLVGSEGLFGAGSRYLGILEDGHLGNWTDGLSSTSDRRSSTGWAVFQSMLANMKYSHIMFGHTSEYQTINQYRLYQRAFYFDPYDAEFYLDDYGYYDSTDTYKTYNTLNSGSYIDHLGVGVAVGLTFGIFKGSMEESLVLNSPPEEYVVDINGKDYLTDYREQMGGANQVSMYRYMTDRVLSSSASVKDPYPSLAFSQYAQCGGVAFVDVKLDGSPMVAGQLSAWAGWTEAGGGAGTLLSASVLSHAERLVGQITQPRSWASPGSIDSGAIARASAAWWDSWKLVYPDQPNWPPYEAQQGTATQYFPVALENPQGEREMWVEENDRWSCDHGGIFGNFEMAFPDYPFGWDNEEMHTIIQNDEAVASYEWTFKAMPA